MKYLNHIAVLLIFMMGISVGYILRPPMSTFSYTSIPVPMPVPCPRPDRQA